MSMAILDDFQTTVATGGIDGTAMILPVTATFPVAARGQQVLLRVEDNDGTGRPAGTSVEHMVVAVPANGVGPVTVVSRPIAPTIAVPHPADSIITAVVTGDVMRNRFTSEAMRQMLRSDLRGSTLPPVWMNLTNLAPSDAVQDTGRYAGFFCPVSPSDAPLTHFVTYIHTAAPAGLAWCKAYVCDATTYKVLGRTVELIGAGFMASAGRKEWPLTADAGASLVIPKDTVEVLNIIRFAGTDVPQFLIQMPGSGAFAAGLYWERTCGYGSMPADPAPNDIFVPSFAGVMNAGWNTNIWSGVK